MTPEGEMTDGPHKSLSMRPEWKRVAERADKAAFTPEEVCEGLVGALQKDWKREVPLNLPKKLRSIVCDRKGRLFDDRPREDLDALWPPATGHTLASVFLDFAIMAVDAGYEGDEAVVRVASQNGIDRQVGRLSASLRLPEETVRAKLMRVRRQHEREWKGFLDSLGSESFVSHWALGA